MVDRTHVAEKKQTGKAFPVARKTNGETAEMTQELHLFLTDSIPAILKNQSSQDAKKPGSNDSGKSRRDAPD
ncbi:MAG: hypothetical protein ACPGXX_13850, partial [Planctomycetaceae bacterium]